VLIFYRKINDFISEEVFVFIDPVGLRLNMNAGVFTGLLPGIAGYQACDIMT
jgi:hypothetical protein